MYEFPIINHIDDILPAIEGRKEFVVAERDGYKIVNYSVMMPDSFPNLGEPFSELRRECRGIIFDTEGNLIRRPLHKFFNINERAETLSSKLQFSEPHFIEDKLDGSMIAPFIVHGKLIWGTKMAALDFHEDVASWIEYNPIYEKISRWLIKEANCTPIFEWTSPKNRIVVDYKNTGLTLLAIRSMPTGNYASKNSIESFRSQGISVVNHYDSVTDIDKFIEDTKNLIEVEGYVVSWESGYKVKAKCDWYVQIHKAKEKILFERHIFKMFYENTLDDVLAFLPQEDVEKINNYISSILIEIDSYTEYVAGALDIIREVGHNRKSFALSSFSESLDSLTKSICFRFFDDYNQSKIRDYVLEKIHAKTSTNANYAEIKEKIFPEVKYFLDFSEE